MSDRKFALCFFSLLWIIPSIGVAQGWMLGESELPALREKAAKLFDGASEEKLIAQADGLLSLEASPYRDWFSGKSFQPRKSSNHFAPLGMAYLLSGEERFLKHAESLTLSAAEQVIDGEIDLAELKGLQLGGLTASLAITLGLVGDSLPPQNRQKIETALRRFAEALETNAEDSTWATDDPVRSGWNWNGVCSGALGMAGLALNEEDWITFGARRIRSYFDHCLDATGYTQEGMGYLEYGLTNATLFAHGYERRTEENLASGTNALLLTRYLEAMMRPSDHRLVADSQYGTDGRASMRASSGFFLASQMDAASRERFYGLWLRMNGERALGGSESWGMPKSGRYVPAWSMLPTNSAFQVLWADPQVDADLSELPQGQHLFPFDAGFVSSQWRSEKGNGHISVTAGQDHPHVWRQSDEGSFTFSWNDHNLIIDPGAGFASGRQHNTIGINGTYQGKKNQQDSGSQFSAGTPFLKQDERSGSVTFSYGNVFSENRPEAAYRSLAWVWDPYPILIVRDRIQPQGQSGANVYSLALQTEIGQQFSFNESEQKGFILSDDGNKICETFLTWPEEATANLFEKRQDKSGKQAKGPWAEFTCEATGPVELITILFPQSDTNARLTDHRVTNTDQGTQVDVFFENADSANRSAYRFVFTESASESVGIQIVDSY